MVMHRTWTVVYDDREKLPLIFPEHLVTRNPESGKLITVRIKKQRLRIPFRRLLSPGGRRGHEDRTQV